MSFIKDLKRLFTGPGDGMKLVLAIEELNNTLQGEFIGFPELNIHERTLLKDTPDRISDYKEEVYIWIKAATHGK